MTYSVVLTSDESGGFVVSVPMLPGCVSQGETREEALANIREAASAYVESLIAHGEEIPREDDRDVIELPISA